MGRFLIRALGCADCGKVHIITPNFATTSAGSGTRESVASDICKDEAFPTQLQPGVRAPQVALITVAHTKRPQCSQSVAETGGTDFNEKWDKVSAIVKCHYRLGPRWLDPLEGGSYRTLRGIGESGASWTTFYILTCTARSSCHIEKCPIPWKNMLFWLYFKICKIMFQTYFAAKRMLIKQLYARFKWPRCEGQLNQPMGSIAPILNNGMFSSLRPLS